MDTLLTLPTVTSYQITQIEEPQIFEFGISNYPKPKIVPGESTGWGFGHIGHAMAGPTYLSQLGRATGPKLKPSVRNTTIVEPTETQDYSYTETRVGSVNL